MSDKARQTSTSTGSKGGHSTKKSRIARASHTDESSALSHGIGSVVATNIRPLQSSTLTFQETFNLLNSRKLTDLVCGAKLNFYFLVKWEGKSCNECTWESEYFLKDQYEQILLFSAQKNAEQIISKKGKYFSAINLLEDIITTRRFSVKGMEICIPETVSKRILLTIEDELSQKKDMCLQSTSGYDISILIYLQQIKTKTQRNFPTLIVCETQEVQRWKSLLTMYFPQWDVLKLETSILYDQEQWQSEQMDGKSSLERSDVVVADLETVKVAFHRVKDVGWEYIVMDAQGPSDAAFKVLDQFNKPYNRSPAHRIACVPALTVQSVGKAVISQSIALQAALRRFANSASLANALLAQGLFASASEATLDFYLATTAGASLLAGVPSSELPALESRLDRPLFVSPLPVVAKAVLRTLVLRLSDPCKADYARRLADHSPWLLACEKNKKTAEAAKQQLVALCEVAATIDDHINPKIVDDDARTLEIDAKLRWIVKFLEALKLRGQTGRIVLLFVSEKAQLRSFPVLQRFTKYCCWQINNNIDAAESNIRISEFSRVEHKMTILTVNYKNLWKLSGVRSSLIILMGQTGDPYQTEMKVKLFHN